MFEQFDSVSRNIFDNRVVYPIVFMHQPMSHSDDRSNLWNVLGKGLINFVRGDQGFADDAAQPFLS